MSDDRDPKEDNPTEELKQGLGHLWRAARGAANSLKKEVDRTNFAQAFEDAGRELTRAATNVVGRISTEISKKPEPPSDGPDAVMTPKEPDEEDDYDGVKPKPKATGPTPEDPGFRIMLDEDEDKKPR